MNRDQAIQDIVNQLEQLQIQQSDLLQHLGRLSEAEDNNGGTTAPTATTQTFAIGDSVRIRNPGRSQPTTGVIAKIRRSRITVESSNGTKIVLAPRNIVLER